MLVGFDHADDAGVYLLTPELAIVQTVDFFTPIVDDPFTFGEIAATNALSDVYAMGGRPVSALAMVCFPDNEDLAVLEQILAGGLSKMVEAGCTVIGGHSIRDPEIKFGYAVTGTIHPRRIFANGGARVGDALVLTKSIGTGVISTAIKKSQAQPGWIDAAVRSMTTLNKAAAEVVIRFAAAKSDSSTNNAGGTVIHAMTDVTGFGLIGHAREMALASNVDGQPKITLHIDSAAVPVLDGALECVRLGFVPGGLKSNREFAESCVVYTGEIAEDRKTLLYDPQTAGGLLIAVAGEHAAPLIKEFVDAGVHAVHIGDVDSGEKTISIR